MESYERGNKGKRAAAPRTGWSAPLVTQPRELFSASIDRYDKTWNQHNERASGRWVAAQDTSAKYPCIAPGGKGNIKRGRREGLACRPKGFRTADESHICNLGPG